jgi:hypothetical protein
LISTEPSLAYSEATTCITVAHQIFVLDVGERRKTRKKKEKGTKKEEDLQPWKPAHCTPEQAATRKRVQPRWSQRRNQPR